MQQKINKTSLILVIGIILSTVYFQQIYAEQALVRSYDQPESSIGHSFLTHYGEKCVAILPEHVAQQAEVPSFLKEGNKNLLGEAESINNLGDDIAVAELFGRITTECGYSITTISRSIDNILRNQGLGTIRFIGSDGAIINISVTIVDNASGSQLFIKSSTDEQIRQGHSGSILMVNRKPVGMLLSVSKQGIGTVFRLDSLLSRVEKHLAKVARQPTKGKTNNPTKDLALAANGGEISGWSVNPVDSKHRATNLIKKNKTEPWRAKVIDWPVDLEIDLAGGKSVINAIWLDAKNIPEVERLSHVEIFVNTSADKKNWRSLSNYNADYDKNGLSTFSFAPTWARHVKVSIANNQSGSNIVSLRGISVFGP